MLHNDKPKKRQIALNIQTTGVEPEVDDRIIELAALEYIDGVYTGNNFSTLINPEGKEISEEITRCNGITNEDVADAPIFADIADKFFDFIKEDDVILQNASFTIRFIDCEMYDREYKAGKMVAQLNAQIAEIENEPENILKEKLPELSNLRMLCEHYNKIAKNIWLNFCVDRTIHDVMVLDQKLYPRREGNSHALNSICARFKINIPIDHIAETRAKLAMQAYQHLCAEDERRTHALSQKKHTMFANKRSGIANAQDKEAPKQQKTM